MKKPHFLCSIVVVASLALSSAAQAAHIDVSGLIHLWNGNGNADDSIGSADGSLGVSTQFSPGVNGQAFDFDGSQDSNITLPVDISPSSLPQMTMGMYINVRSILNDRGWVIGHDNGGYDRSLIISDTRFGQGLAAGVGSTYTSSLFDLGDNLDKWFGIAVSYDQLASTATVYINDLEGNSFTQTVNTTLGNGQPNASVGGLNAFAGHGVDALVDDVFIYNRALSQSELDIVFTPVPSVLALFGLAFAALIRLRSVNAVS
ncbi:LamG-like jellyroll fold domain-containing protein [Glaciecola petra]|uniref:LamG-like jellyroll fold domain-containing protein n=1 Tax=Glaciecola petra TaxID=3075602 RepID=A0ABU2ZQX7_9ALTE|nr:LamG-like jellyroll fold domain-containing protein [Aestuariibacter sp. P117]MDT0595038.1 LamG-like jellyroll fold domain-containing protein [Aestuariibacter sp. P117]